MSHQETAPTRKHSLSGSTWDRSSPVRVYLSVTEVPPDEDFSEADVVVIDQLRTTSTWIRALLNRAHAILPVESIEEARELAAKTPGVLLGGERKGQHIEGFDFGNSPSEYTAQAVAGKTIVFSSTNGTPAVRRAENARRCLIGALSNVAAVTQVLLGSHEIVFLCAGNYGRFSIEDTLVAGFILDRLSIPQSLLNDQAKVAASLYRVHARDLGRTIANGYHGRYLASVGLGEELAELSRVDINPVLGRYRDGRIERA